MLGTGSGDAPGEYLSPFRNETAQRIGVLVVNFQLLEAELANLFLEENFALAAPAIFAVPSVHLGIQTPVTAIKAIPVAPFAIASFTIDSGRTLAVFNIFFVRHINLC